MPAPDQNEGSEPTRIRAWLVRHRTALVEGGWAIAAYVLLGGVVLAYDGFGFSTATNNRSSDVVGQVFASKYDRDSESRDPASRPVVVLVTDETLRHPTFQAEASGWPPTFDLHAKVLSRILEEQPSVLFIDVLFRDKRGEEGALEKALDGYAKACPRIPVLLAAGHGCPPEGDDREARLGEQMARPFIGRTWPIAVPALPDGRDNASRQYPLWQTVDSRSGCPTAALAMYWAMQNGPALAALPDAKPLDSARLRTMVEGAEGGNPFLEPLEVIWGARRYPTSPGRRRVEIVTSADGSDDASADCSEGLPANPASAVLASLAGYDLRQRCSYLETIHAEDLMLASPGALLRGHPVLYGVSFTGADDLIFSPVHGRIAGIHQHAMALDNLLAWGTSYVRRANKSEFGPVGLPSWVDLILLCSGGVLFAFWRWKRSKDRHQAIVGTVAAWGVPDRLRLREGGTRTAQVVKEVVLWVIALLLTILGGLIPVALVLAIGWVLFSVFDQAPINWVGHLVVFAGVVGLLELRGRVKQNHRILLRTCGLGAAGAPKGGS